MEKKCRYCGALFDGRQRDVFCVRSHYVKWKREEARKGAAAINSAASWKELQRMLSFNPMSDKSVKRYLDLGMGKRGILMFQIAYKRRLHNLLKEVVPPKGIFMPAEIRKWKNKNHLYRVATVNRHDPRAYVSYRVGGGRGKEPEMSCHSKLRNPYKYNNDEDKNDDRLKCVCGHILKRHDEGCLRKRCKCVMFTPVKEDD